MAELSSDEVTENTGPGHKIASAAIDLGTSYSGWALSFTHDYNKDPLQIHSRNWLKTDEACVKTPTCILINGDGRYTVEAFGFDAERRYAELIEERREDSFYYFRYFKMCLYDQHDCHNLMITDANGRSLPALTVFSLSIGYLMNDLLHTCSKQLDNDLNADDVTWVVTIPAIWSDANKLFMRAAAIKAGIHTDDLRLALEPEVATLYIRHIRFRKAATRNSGENGLVQSFDTGNKFLVVDAGGGTVDITVYEVTDGRKLAELRAASGGPWGSGNVNEAFRKFLADVFTLNVLQQFEKHYKDDNEELMQSFELCKRQFEYQDVRIRLPFGFSENYFNVTGKSISVGDRSDVKIIKDKLVITKDRFKEMFSGPLESIVQHIRKLFRQNSVRNANTIILVGGFAQNVFLCDVLKKEFPDKRLVVPPEPGSAILKGATIYGQETKHIVVSRMSQYSYGVKITMAPTPSHPKSRISLGDDGKEYVRGVFLKLITKGETCNINQPSEPIPLSAMDSEKELTLEVFASNSLNPQFVDEEGCFKIGEIVVDCRDNIGNPRDVEVRLCLGGPELSVIAVHTRTKAVTIAKFTAEYHLYM